MFNQKRLKINIEYVYDVSFVCGLIKTYIFLQEIFHKERIPAGSQEENDGLKLSLIPAQLDWVNLIIYCFSLVHWPEKLKAESGGYQEGIRTVEEHHSSAFREFRRMKYEMIVEIDKENLLLSEMLQFSRLGFMSK